MLKFLALIFLLLAVLPCATFAQNAYNPLGFWARGAVRTIRIEKFRVEIKRGVRSENLTKVETITYDQASRTIERAEEESRSVSILDAEGNEIETAVYTGAELFMRSTRTRNQDGSWTETTYAADGSVLGKERRSIITKGKVEYGTTESSGIDPASGKLATTVRRYVNKRVYDSQGREIESTTGESEGNPSHKLLTEYDAGGLVRRSISVQYGQVDATHSVKLGRNETMFDARGDELRRISYDSQGKITHETNFTREYDSRSNWIVETAVHTGTEYGKPFKFTEVTRRTLTYF